MLHGSTAPKSEEASSTANFSLAGLGAYADSLDLVNDPTTGATFEAPYDTYNQTGPDGSGYYDQANNKLTIETP